MLNKTEYTGVQHGRIEDYLLQWSSETPNSEAVVDSKRRLTYAQFNAEVVKAARLMRAYGVVDGSCVAVLAPPSIDAFVSFLAANMLGATWLGVNPKYTQVEIAHVIHDAHPALVLVYSQIGERRYEEDLRAIYAGVRERGTTIVLLDDFADLDGFEKFGSRGECDLSCEKPTNDVALYVYTSGTTGKPKAARIPHKALVRGASVRADVWSVTPFRSINNLPINHIGSIGDIACTTLVAGGCQVFLERFSPTATLECLEREQISFWYQVPTMFQLCLDASDGLAIDWSYLQAAIWSGGRAPLPLIQRLSSIAKYLAVDYSMTESVGAIALTPLQTGLNMALTETVGWPDAGRGLRIVNVDTLCPVAVGEAGEAQIKDSWMFDGYRDRVQAADTLTSDGWFRTGDMVKVGDDGTWRIVGRSREMFKSGGYNVYPREIEQAIETHPMVAAVAVIEAPDPLYGEVGVAYIVSKNTTLNSQSLDTHCRNCLANYKIPKQFIFVDQLPILQIGKVDKVELRRKLATEKLSEGRVG
jgi:acyl-CoA synthetase (AMP-forming)/AMP-acid ligase II